MRWSDRLRQSSSHCSPGIGGHPTNDCINSRKMVHFKIPWSASLAGFLSGALRSLPQILLKRTPAPGVLSVDFEVAQLTASPKMTRVGGVAAPSDPLIIRTKEPFTMTKPKICKIHGCLNPVKARGWCNTHYTRATTHGDPLKTVSTPPGVAFGWIKKHINFVGNDCLIWPFKRTTFGYPSFGGRTKFGTDRAHRVMCELVHGSPKRKELDVAHSCGVRLCMNPSHLRWASRSENERDKRKHGKDNRGERHGRSKLLAREVAKIRQLGLTQRPQDIAETFGISARHVRDIVKRKTWSWLP